MLWYYCLSGFTVLPQPTVFPSFSLCAFPPFRLSPKVPPVNTRRQFLIHAPIGLIGAIAACRGALKEPGASKSAAGAPDSAPGAPPGAPPTAPRPRPAGVAGHLAEAEAGADAPAARHAADQPAPVAAPARRRVGRGSWRQPVGCARHALASGSLSDTARNGAAGDSGPPAMTDAARQLTQFAGRAAGAGPLTRIY
jgi:hypothetical protein